MKPTIDQLKSLTQGVDERLIREHVERLDEDYFQRFDEQRIAGHLEGLAKLSSSRPVEVLLEPGAGDGAAITVLAMDYPTVFNLICGVLAGTGFSIRRGEVFTYRRAVERRDVKKRMRHRRPPRRTADPTKRRRIIDHFVGVRPPDKQPDDWADHLRNELAHVMKMLESRAPEAMVKARHHVNEMVTERLVHQESVGTPALLPIEVNIDTADDRTRLRVVGQDTPAFLYALSNALSLQDLVIEHVRIDTDDGRVSDEIDFVDAQGRAVTDPARLDRVKFCVLLTKQFTYFLDRAPDPYRALSRYEQMVDDILGREEAGRWLDLLQDPKAMQHLARLLGASDYLWEEFIRVQYEQLAPLFGSEVGDQPLCPPIETLPDRLRRALEEADRPSEKRTALNRFKDREIFQIDLDHILNPQTDFRTLAERLTVLAEQVVGAAADLAYDGLAADHGKPQTADGAPARWAIFGLGKLGGAALGYASDIEWMLVYDGEGETGGDEALPNGEFFSRLVRETASCIEAKQEGIFRVDLRLRPYGKEGPLAVHAAKFEQYYQPGGDAAAFERLALVRLRPIAGDPALGRRIEQMRDRLIHEQWEVDVDELAEMRHAQYRQKRGTQFNAKFSPGGLVDLEYTVQTIQVIHGREHAELRTPRIHEALGAMGRLGVLGEGEARRLNKSYNFLRELINALRMLRGDAQDLFLPERGTPEFRFLARRMGYERTELMRPSERLWLDLAIRTAIVRAFVTRCLGRHALPDRTFGNVADVLVTDDLPGEIRRKVLWRCGFRDPDAADTVLRQAQGSVRDRARLARLIVHATDHSDAVRRAVLDDPSRLRWLMELDRGGDEWALTDIEQHFQQRAASTQA